MITALSRSVAATLIAVSGLALAQPAAQPTPQPAAQPEKTVNADAVQAPTPSTPRKNTVPVGTSKQNADLPRFNLEFKGGTVSEYIELLQSIDGINANVVASADARTFEVGPVSLRQVTVYDAVQSMRMARWTGENPVTGEPPSLSVDERGDIFLVGIQWRGQMPQGTRSVRTSDSVTVFSIPEGGSTGKSPETILTALDAGMQLLGGERPPKLSYHRDSGLLFVNASGKQLRVMTDVLTGLRDSRAVIVNEQKAQQLDELLGSLGAATMDAARDLIESRKTERQVVTMNYDKLEREKARIESQLSYVSTMAEEHRAVASKLRNDLAQAEMARQQAERQVSDLAKEVARLRAAANPAPGENR